MKFTTAFTAFLPTLNVVLALPVTSTSAEIEAKALQTPNSVVDAGHIAGRDSLWPWERPPHIIGEYPDGRKKCRIMSMTA
jgi:hypothetical protein